MSVEFPMTASLILALSHVLQGIDYVNLDYGSKLKFATVGSNNGHDGDNFDGAPLLDSEVLADFTAEGRSKKAAKEAAAKLMALSGHCVSSASVILCSNV